MDLYIIQALSAAFLFGISATCFKWSAQGDGHGDHFLLGLYTTGSCLFFISSFYAEGGYFDHLSLSAFTPAVIIGGILVGMGSAVGNFFFVKSLKAGPASLTGALAKANILPVIAMSYFFYDEEIGALKFLGIIFVAVALFSVSITRKKDKRTDIETTWLFLVFGMIVFFALRNGGLKVTDELGFMGEIILWIGYGSCAFWFLFMTFLNLERVKFDRRAFGIGIFSGCFSFGGLYMYMTALKNGPASIVATIFALDMVFILIFVHILFHERLSRIQKFGFGMSLVGFIFIGL